MMDSMMMMTLPVSKVPANPDPISNPLEAGRDIHALASSAYVYVFIHVSGLSTYDPSSDR